MLPRSVRADAVERTIRAAAGDLLETVTVIDEYRASGGAGRSRTRGRR